MIRDGMAENLLIDGRVVADWTNHAPQFAISLRLSFGATEKKREGPDEMTCEPLRKTTRNQEYFGSFPGSVSYRYSRRAEL